MRVSVVATGIASNTQGNNQPSIIPTKTEAITPRSGIIVPDPRESFSAPSHDLSSELMTNSMGNLETDTTANVDTNTLSKMTCNDGQPDVALDWDASAKDLDDQLNNDMANEAISKIIDTPPKNSAQIDIGIPNNPATSKIPTEDNELGSKVLESQVTMGNAPMMPLTPISDKKTPSKEHFIPDATKNIPDEETMTKAAETPVRRPSSLINRISGLWTSKPNVEKAQPESGSSPEPTLDEAASKDQIAVSILDLSRPEIGHQDNKAIPKPTQNLDDSELDIPAFLRRQAN